MVHPLYALLAYPAVMHAWFFDEIAFETVTGVVQHFDLIAGLGGRYILGWPLILLALQVFLSSLSCRALFLIY